MREVRRRSPQHPHARSTHGSSRSGTAERLLRLRRASDRAGAERLVVVTLRIEMAQDHWLGRFSHLHPELRLEALYRMTVDRRTSVLDYWIAGGPPGCWTREIAAYPDVRRIEALAEMGDGCLYRIVQRTNPIAHLYSELRLPLKFPLSIRGGSIAWEVVAKRREFDTILAFLARRRLGVTGLSVRGDLLPGTASILSPRQQRLLTEAMSAGYFSVPRGITLTELAERLGRSKSALSESLAVIERSLLEHSLERSMPLLPPGVRPP